MTTYHVSELDKNLGLELEFDLTSYLQDKYPELEFIICDTYIDYKTTEPQTANSQILIIQDIRSFIAGWRYAKNVMQHA